MTTHIITHLSSPPSIYIIDLTQVHPPNNNPTVTMPGLSHKQWTKRTATTPVTNSLKQHRSKKVEKRSKTQTPPVETGT